MNQPDQALQQFDKSLQINPKHPKTLLNQGIVRAFGKQDLQGAAESWERLIQVAPSSPEADMARQTLERFRSAHPGLGGPAGGMPPGK
jgi:regulator of sirC expression with transglutaminase-like and TPR domain